MVRAYHWLKNIETYTFLWQLTLTSANHASSNSGQGPVSQKPRNFSGLFRGQQFPIYLRNAEFLSLQVHIPLVFLTLKTCKNISFSKQADHSFTTDFSSGQKRSRNVWETGPRWTTQTWKIIATKKLELKSNPPRVNVLQLSDCQSTFYVLVHSLLQRVQTHWTSGKKNMVVILEIKLFP